MVEVYHSTYAITWVDPTQQLLVLVMFRLVQNVDKPQQTCFQVEPLAIHLQLDFVLYRETITFLFLYVKIL